LAAFAAERQREAAPNRRPGESIRARSFSLAIYGPYKKKYGRVDDPASLQPRAKGRRLVFNNNDLRVIDGPFVESKELIGGFAVMELSDMAEAIELCRRYAKISLGNDPGAEILGGTMEIDLRLVDMGEVA